MRWTTRIRGGHRDPVVEAEAAVDLRDAQLEAKDKRIEELEGELAKAKVALALALTTDWMGRGLRDRGRRDPNGPTAVLPATSLRRFRR